MDDMTIQSILVPEFDLSDPMVVADTLAPALGQRLGAVLGNVDAIVSGIQDAGKLLTSGDGLAISTNMAQVINMFTNWLRGRSEENAEETRLNLRNHQLAFMKDTPIAWMTRKDVGAKRALGQVILKRKPFVKMSDMLNQFAPGAVYTFSRLGYDLIRRSFKRTDSPNAFDDGQPDIMKAIAALSDEQRQPLECMSNLAGLIGQGCCYYPGEKIQFSFGTYPYIHGRAVTSFVYVDPEVPFIRHAALMTPSAHHVMIDEGDVYNAYLHWSDYVNLKQIPDMGKGQKDPGVYRDAQGLPQEIGGTQYWAVPRDGYSEKIPAKALREVTAAFYNFFVVRQMVLRQFGWLAPTVQAAAKDSKDERIRKLARGEKIPLWKWDPFDPLLQLEQIPEGTPNLPTGKKTTPDKGNKPKDEPKDEPKQSTSPPPATSEDNSTEKVPWLDLGMLLAGVGGAAYVGRKDIARWIRERFR